MVSFGAAEHRFGPKVNANSNSPRRCAAFQDQEPRLARRFHAIALSVESHTLSQIAQSLKVHRS